MNDEDTTKKAAGGAANAANEATETDDVTFEPIKQPKASKTPSGASTDDSGAASDGAHSSDSSDDVVMDDEAAPSDQVKKLKEKLAKATQEKQEYLDGWQRSRAELINLRKRDEEEKREFMKYASEGLIADLLPVLDSFEMARANKESWEKVDKNWRMGIEYINSQLMQVLDSRGLKIIDPMGMPFDPMRDEAIEYVPVTAESDDQKVIQVIQKGYTLNGRSIKAPKVKIGQFKK